MSKKFLVAGTLILLMISHVFVSNAQTVITGEPALPLPEPKSPPGVDQAGTDMPFSYDEEYSKYQQMCVEKAAPIDQGEFFMALLNLHTETDRVFSDSITTYLICRQFTSPEVNRCNIETLLNSGHFDVSGKSAVTNETITADEEAEARKTLAALGKNCEGESFLPLLIKGVDTISGQKLPQHGCSSYPAAKKAGCEKNISLILEAMEKSAPEICDGINEMSLPGSTDFCLLFSTRDPDMCKIKGFLKPFPYETCRDFLLAFNMIRNNPIEEGVVFNAPDSALAVAARASKDANACESFFQKSILSLSCDWQSFVAGEKSIRAMEAEFIKTSEDLREQKEESDIKFIEETKKIDAEMKKLREEKEKMESGMDKESETQGEETPPDEKEDNTGETVPGEEKPPSPDSAAPGGESGNK